MRKPITLIAGQHGSRHFGTAPYLADAFTSTGRAKPLALYVGAASGDDHGFGAALSALLEEAGAHRVLWPKLGATRQAAGQARSALEEADLVFVGGGDVDAGMRVLRDAGLVDELLAAVNRGVVFAGMSAGAIMLGERWIRWAHAGAGDDEAETYACLSLAACCVDTHAEDEDWQEARSFVAVRAREAGTKARVYGIPSGAALVIGGDGSMHARGERVCVFAALPNEPPEIEETLETS